jgi:hypothetical protein
MRVTAWAAVLVTLVGFSVPGHRPALPTEYFDSPLRNDLLLAGNFAEMRANHFHSGLDLKTDGREGLPIHAAAEGWVSRIKVSPYGYGNALYVEHPNGYTTVYGHLRSFAEPYADYVRKLQYARERFDLDIYPREGEFPVARGAEIARSGNTGGSFGPHLHFEIRETAGQAPVNPLLFDFDIVDTIPPRIFRVKVYPAGPSSHLNLAGSASASTMAGRPIDPVVIGVTEGSAQGEYSLDSGLIGAFGEIVFGIETHDYHNDSNNRLGTWRIMLEANGALLFRSTLERVAFNETRYINAHVDYAERQTNGHWIQRSHMLPGNRLPYYEVAEGGRLNVRPDSTYHMRYVVEDAAGNTSTLTFTVKGEEAIDFSRLDQQPPDAVIPRQEAFTFARREIRVQFDANTFYADQPFDYELLPATAGALSLVHQIHEDTAPLHKPMSVSIRADGLAQDLRSKALLGTLDDDGKIVSAGGGYANGFVTGRPRSFGRYFIVADTVAPEVALLGVSADGRPASNSVLEIRATDDLSGLRAYNAYFDGEWALLEYDAKKNMLRHHLRERPSAGKHEFSVVVDDNKENLTRRAFEVVY